MADSIGALDLQSVIYSALTTAIQNVSVYDDIPETADTPYIVIGEDSVGRIGCKTEDIDEIKVTVYVYSSYKGMKEVKELSCQVIEALKGIKLETSDVMLQYLRLESVEYRKEGDDMREAEIEAVFLAS